jgi:hypothetical protein
LNQLTTPNQTFQSADGRDVPELSQQGRQAIVELFEALRLHPVDFVQSPNKNNKYYVG